jgi:hypothetical protein
MVQPIHATGPRAPLGIAFAAVVLLASCIGGVREEGMDRDAPRPDGPSYDLTVTIAGRGEQKFRGTLTTWDASTGIITLGPEERGEPLGLFILTLGQFNTIYDPPIIIDAKFSTTRVRVGTAAELQAELYGATAPRCGLPAPHRQMGLEDVVVTPDWVTGHVCLLLAGLEPDGVPSSAWVVGEFAAFAP